MALTLMGRLHGWRQPPGPAVAAHRRRVALGVLGGLLALVLLAALARWQAAMALQAALVDADARAVAEAASPPDDPAASGRGFVDSLPAQAPTAQLLADLQEAALLAGAQVAGFQVSARDGGTRALARLDVAVTLRGTYPQIKHVLDGVAGSPAAPVLRRLAIRRMASAAELEAQVEWGLLWRPVPAGPGQAQVADKP